MFYSLINIIHRHSIECLLTGFNHNMNMENIFNLYKRTETHIRSVDLFNHSIYLR
ncbi:unnamed protein product [Phytomonas sp. Hart1]|nr:unnamed protein product [Phytomonas sp. Hart1]|eukprot:CCW66345.1 unnamed protein product [Phytomonas sp. isolate Hart1]